MTRLALTADSECDECGGTGAVYVDGAPPHTICRCVEAMPEPVSPPVPTPSESACPFCLITHEAIEVSGVKMIGCPKVPPGFVIPVGPNGEIGYTQPTTGETQPTTTDSPRQHQASPSGSGDPIEWLTQRRPMYEVRSLLPTTLREMVGVVRAASEVTKSGTAEAIVELGIALDALREKLRKEMC